MTEHWADYIEVKLRLWTPAKRVLEIVIKDCAIKFHLKLSEYLLFGPVFCIMQSYTR